MAVSPTWPGVYVQEVPSGVRTISGVSTSVALFIGYTKQGPTDAPVQCLSYTDYKRTFGDDNSAGEMHRQVKMAFLNGLTTAYVLRVAENADPATLPLLAEDGTTTVLTLSARNSGTDGNRIRAQVTYPSTDPEGSFNLTLFRWKTQSNGSVVSEASETWNNLSMNPSSARYVVDFLESNSELVEAAIGSGTRDTAKSIGATAFDNSTDPNFIAAWDAVVASGSNTIRLSVDGSQYVDVTLPAADTDAATTATNIKSAISSAFSTAMVDFPSGDFTADFTVSFETLSGTDVVLQFESTWTDDACAVKVLTGTSDDAAVGLEMGIAQGGMEIGCYGAARPAHTGVSINPQTLSDAGLMYAATSETVDIHKYDSDGNDYDITAYAITLSGSTLGDKLESFRDEFNDIATSASISSGESFPWEASVVGWRLVITPTDGPIANGSDDDRDSGFGTSIGFSTIVDNIRYYALGNTTAASYSGAGTAGTNGTAPSATSTYTDAFDLCDEEVDLFNLLLLPKFADDPDFVEDIWSYASAWCEERRALLLMGPPEGWTSVQGASNDITNTRIGMSKQYSAVYYPKITIREDSVDYNIDPIGAVAGIMARTDNSRGVWKAPAGTEATLRGVVGLKSKLSDAQNGVLNPKGINCIRQLPDGICVWGARTLDGYDEAGSEYKYVPVRRLASYMGESLYRGLRWVVFEPNDEPLWAQIRLNVGAFMHDLYRKGAFQGTKPSDAYFVKCDSETTTSTDQNLGIVNIWVGFAPLKPAEFVVISLQQMAGQSAV